MIEEKEEWRSIDGYPNYQVSNLGRVKSIKRKVKKWNGYRTVSECILKPRKNRYGYLQLLLSNENKRKTMLVHRLVCEAFLPNPLNLPQINHLNEDKTDNRLENLEYCTAKYNCNFGTRNERLAKEFSKPVKCLETGKIYPSTMYLEKELGFNHSNIVSCCNKKYGYKTYKGFHWEYV